MREKGVTVATLVNGIGVDFEETKFMQNFSDLMVRSYMQVVIRTPYFYFVNNVTLSLIHRFNELGKETLRLLAVSSGNVCTIAIVIGASVDQERPTSTRRFGFIVVIMQNSAVLV